MQQLSPHLDTNIQTNKQTDCIFIYIDIKTDPITTTTTTKEEGAGKRCQALTIAQIYICMYIQGCPPPHPPDFFWQLIMDVDVVCVLTFLY